jgi:Flp pilus assembly protein TadD
MALVGIATPKRLLIYLVVGLTSACGSARDDTKKVPSNAGEAGTLIRVADRMRTEGAIEPALSIYRQAEAAAPSRPEPKIGKGEALLALGSYGEAGEAFSGALRQMPDNPDALRGLALALMRNGQPGLALDPLDRLIAVVPDEPRSYSLAGIARDLMGDHAGAQTKYRTGLARVPGQPGLASNLALSLALVGDFAGAVATLEPLVARPDATTRLRQNLALVYGLGGDAGKAAQIGRFDLDEAAVAANLASYQQLRALPVGERTRALLIGGAKSGALEPAS